MKVVVRPQLEDAVDEPVRLDVGAVVLLVDDLQHGPGQVLLAVGSDVGARNLGDDVGHGRQQCGSDSSALCLDRVGRDPVEDRLQKRFFSMKGLDLSHKLLSEGHRLFGFLKSRLDDY